MTYFFKVMNCHHVKRKTTLLSYKYTVEGNDGDIENILSPLVDEVLDKKSFSS